MKMLNWSGILSMAMTCLNNRKNDSFIFSTIKNPVPLDHMVRELEEAIDWTFIYPLVKTGFYKPFGRPSIDPVVLFKKCFLSTYICDSFNEKDMKK